MSCVCRIMERDMFFFLLLLFLFDEARAFFLLVESLFLSFYFTWDPWVSGRTSFSFALPGFMNANATNSLNVCLWLCKLAVLGVKIIGQTDGREWEINGWALGSNRATHHLLMSRNSVVHYVTRLPLLNPHYKRDYVLYIMRNITTVLNVILA